MVDFLLWVLNGMYYYCDQTQMPFPGLFIDPLINNNYFLAVFVSLVCREVGGRKLWNRLANGGFVPESSFE